MNQLAQDSDSTSGQEERAKSRERRLRKRLKKKVVASAASTLDVNSSDDSLKIEGDSGLQPSKFSLNQMCFISLRKMSSFHENSDMEITNLKSSDA